MTKRKLRNRLLKTIQIVVDMEAGQMPIIDVLEVLKKFNLTMKFKAVKGEPRATKRITKTSTGL